MRRLCQVWMFAFVTAILAGGSQPVWPQDIVPAGTTEGVVQERQVATPAKPISRERTEVPEVQVAPRFTVNLSGSDSEMAQQAFLEYARAIGQPVDLLSYGGRFEIYLREETDQSRDAWGGAVAEIGRRATRGRIDLRTDDRRVLTLSGEIREGNRIHYVRSSSKAGMHVRVDASAWSGWYNRIYGGRDNDPQQRLRMEAVRDLVPQLMEELQNIVLEEAAAKAAAERELASTTGTRGSAAKARARFSYTVQLTSHPEEDRTIVSARPLRQGQTIKLVRGGRKVGELIVTNFVHGDVMWVRGDVDLAADPSCKLVPVG